MSTSWKLLLSGGKSTGNFAKDRKDAKERQKYYKNSQLIRQYKKIGKREDFFVSAADGGGSGGNDEDGKAQERAFSKKRPRDPASADDAGARGPGGSGSSKPQQPQQPNAKAKKPRARGPAEEGRPANHAFAREKKIAQAARAAKDAEHARIAAAEKDRARKLKHRKEMSKKLAQRDTMGRPRVRNTIANILHKLQKN